MIAFEQPVLLIRLNGRLSWSQSFRNRAANVVLRSKADGDRLGSAEEEGSTGRAFGIG